MLPFPVPSLSFSRATVLYDPKTFITHAASLRQAFAHCARFPTAASRRSLDRVSVPVWLVVLSDQQPVVGLVGRYPANYLMGRGLIPQRIAPFRTLPLENVRISGISSPFGELSQSEG